MHVSFKDRSMLFDVLIVVTCSWSEGFTACLAHYLLDPGRCLLFKNLKVIAIAKPRFVLERGSRRGSILTLLKQTCHKLTLQLEH